jgi:peptidyl-prolyl cis-trans isomerase C
MPVAMLAVVCLFVAACAANPSPQPSPGQPTATLTPLPIASTATTVPTPTQTPEPLALRVNGDGITLVEYNADLKQLQEADQLLGKNSTAEQQRQQVLDNFTATLLLAQGAVTDGFILDDAALKAEMERLSGEMGSEQALTDWINKYGYSPAIFSSALRRQMAAAWERDHIAAQVPQQAEQIHARQILTQAETVANRALEQVNLPGVNFAAQAQRYDPVTGGDLGWFPRGYLLQPEVEQAAFALQPGEISPVIKSQVGYHIIQVIAREPSRALSADARRVLQHKAIQDWVNKQREASKVEVLLP